MIRWAVILLLLAGAACATEHPFARGDWLAASGGAATPPAGNPIWMATNCLACWTFENNSTSSVALAYTPTNRGCDYVAGAVGNGIYLNSATSSVFLAANLLPVSISAATNDYAISAWVKIPNGATNNLNLFSQGTVSTTPYLFVNAASEYGVTNRLIFYAYSRIFTGPALADGNWHHVIYTRAFVGSVEHHKIYLDGAHNMTKTNSSLLTFSLGRNQIGVPAASYATFLSVDSLAVFNSAITDAGASNIFNGYAPQ